LAVCAKNAVNLNDQVIESDMQITRFASLNNDDDYDSDSKELMPMQNDDDVFQPSIQTINQILLWITVLTRIEMMTVIMIHL